MWSKHDDISKLDHLWFDHAPEVTSDDLACLGLEFQSHLLGVFREKGKIEERPVIVPCQVFVEPIDDA